MPLYLAEDVFQHNEAGIALFEACRKAIEALGPTKMTVSKTQVAFGQRRQFAWVWRPARWTKMRGENVITLSFALDREITDSRIAEATEARPGLWIHHLIIEHENDIDAGVKGWLLQAYALAGGTSSGGASRS